jgi:hypothetical protein
MSLVSQCIELGMAVPQVMAHRLTRMAIAGASPSARDRREFHRMGAEKIAALNESWNAMALQAFLANQQLALSCMQSLWFPWGGSSCSARAATNLLSDAALGILGKGMDPIRRSAVANARRLARARRR